MSTLLSVDNLTIRFGGLTAIDNLSFAAGTGQITAIIGPNGAGKTTLFNCITGFYRPQTGTISLHRPEGILRLEGKPDHWIARQAGIARTFQTSRLFPGMTALENLLIAQHRSLMKSSVFSLAGLLGLGRYRRAEQQAVEKAVFWLDQVGLAPCANIVVGTLAYGMQRRLEVARSMCMDPRLLCLDEPAAGLNPKESHELIALLSMIRSRFGTAQLLVEHDMSVVMGLSDKIVVLEYGRKIAEGTPEHIRHNPAVIRAYLGESADQEIPPDIAQDLDAHDLDAHDLDAPIPDPKAGNPC
jgi:branched-chain amino acid transport system ATP-binding protein